jgi:hypothetical protein
MRHTRQSGASDLLGILIGAADQERDATIAERFGDVSFQRERQFHRATRLGKLEFQRSS